MARVLPLPGAMNTSLMTFSHRLEAMVAELDAHPRVRVTCFDRGRPAPVGELRSLHRHLGGRGDPALEALYRHVNGVQVRWHATHPGWPEPEPPRSPRVGLAALDLMDEDGCINLLPVEELLEPERSAPGGPGEAVLLDGFSGFAFTELQATPAGFWRVATRYDFGRARPPDGVRSVAAYLEHLLVTRGLMVARTRSYCADRGIPLPRLPTRWRPDRRLVDALVAAALDGW